MIKQKLQKRINYRPTLAKIHHPLFPNFADEDIFEEDTFRTMKLITKFASIMNEYLKIIVTEILESRNNCS